MTLLNVSQQLPSFWLAYLADPSDSGKIHSNVRQRYDAGDQDVIEYHSLSRCALCLTHNRAMQQFANFAVEAKQAIENQDVAALADLMDKNFRLTLSSLCSHASCPILACGVKSTVTNVWAKQT